MEGPTELWGAEGSPPVAPAVSATINLAVQFFGIYLLHGIVCTYAYFNKDNKSALVKKLEKCVSLATVTVTMAPMLCVLFIGARMRALQIDPRHGAPQAWAQHCFFICVYSVLAQAILCVIVPLFSNCTVEQGPVEGDIVFVGLNGPVYYTATALRYIAILGLYGGFTAVMCSVFLIKAKHGAHTPPVSPALVCILNLCIQYFAIYLILFIAQTTKQASGGAHRTATKIVQMMDSSLKTVMFAPMLGILFIIVRMRSLQLTGASDGTIPPGAGPQLWAQDCMYLSTWALFVQVILVILLSLFFPVKMDEDGNVKPPSGNRGMGIIISLIRYLSMIAMYGGVIGLCVAIFLMKPEELPPYARTENIIPGFKIPQPPTPDTPSIFLEKAIMFR